jgi:hypothetical protein
MPVRFLFYKLKTASKEVSNNDGFPWFSDETHTLAHLTKGPPVLLEHSRKIVW